MNYLILIIVFLSLFILSCNSSESPDPLGESEEGPLQSDVEWPKKDMGDKNTVKNLFEKITKEIIDMKDDYPALSEFSLDNFDSKQMSIDYQYKCEDSDASGGWRQAFPVPTKEGLLIVIDYHDSTMPPKQLHMQIATNKVSYGQGQVVIIIESGEDNKQAVTRIKQMLKQNKL